jgi:hypothetical protein
MTENPRTLTGLSAADRQALVHIYDDLGRKLRFWAMHGFLCYAMLSMCNVRTLATLQEPPSRYAHFYKDVHTEEPCTLETDLWTFLSKELTRQSDQNA